MNKEQKMSNGVDKITLKQSKLASGRAKIILWVVIILIIIAGIWYGVSRKLVTTEKEPIKIGVILPLTGKAAQYGEEMKRGIELAIENKKDISIEVLYEDSKFDTKEGVSAYHRLRVENVSIMITAVSTIALAISPLTNENQVLQMAIAASTPEYTSSNDFTFRVTTRTEVEDKELAKWVINKGYKEIALMYANNDWGLGHYNSIKPEIEKLEGKVVGEENYLIEETDFRTQLTKIKAKNPEAIFLLSDGKTAGIVLKQAKELGVEAQFFGIRSLQSEDLLSIAQEAAEGLVYTYPFDPLSDTPKIKEFVEKYQTKYESLPTSYVAEGYDAMGLILKSLKKCGEANTLCMRDDLLITKDHLGILGSLTFDENGDVYYPYFIKTIKDGQFVPLEN
ncbi:penicillin-binding protein activator [Patescibacteria group bacterium]|nr:penicillin-binding protein activator [Patescibacteria group bacterium]